MSEKSEQVAEAIFEDCAKRDWPSLLGKWETCDPEAKERFRSMAKTAIAAMREPTEAMIDKVMMIQCDLNYGEAVICWKTMIDEALK